MEYHSGDVNHTLSYINYCPFSIKKTENFRTYFQHQSNKKLEMWTDTGIGVKRPKTL